MTTLQRTLPLPTGSARSDAADGPAEAAASWLHGGAWRRLALAALCAASVWTSVAWALAKGA